MLPTCQLQCLHPVRLSCPPCGADLAAECASLYRDCLILISVFWRGQHLGAGRFPAGAGPPDTAPSSSRAASPPFA